MDFILNYNDIITIFSLYLVTIKLHCVFIFYMILHRSPISIILKKEFNSLQLKSLYIKTLGNKCKDIKSKHCKEM